jgi:hypothetical protein
LFLLLFFRHFLSLHARNIKLALQDSVVFDYFRILLSKVKKSKSSSAVANEDAATSEKPATAVAAGEKVVISKATIEEVEKALFAAITENANGENAVEDGEVENSGAVSVEDRGVIDKKSSKKVLQPKKGKVALGVIIVACSKYPLRRSCFVFS